MKRNASFAYKSILILQLSFGYCYCQEWHQTALANGSYGALAVGPNGYVYAGASADGIVYRSIDNGGKWKAYTLPSAHAVNKLSAGADSSVFAATDHGVFRSNDLGENWAQAGLASYDVRSVKAFSGTKALVGTNLHGIFLTVDGGMNWNNVAVESLSVWDLAAGIGDTVYAAVPFADNAGGGVYRSADGGATWKFAGLANSWVSSIAVDHDGVLYAGTLISYGRDNGVFRSTNGGTSWDNDWPYGSYSSAIGMVSDSHSYIYLATSAAGVYQSTGSNSWVERNGGLPYQFLYSVLGIAIGSNDILFVGTSDAGVFSDAVVRLPPILLSPADGSGNQSLTPELSWTPSNGGVSYDLQLSKDENFSTSVMDLDTIVETHKIVELQPASTYYWHVRTHYDTTLSDWSETWSFATFTPSLVMDKPKPVSTFQLAQNYPNPFNPTTRIQFSIPRASFVTLKILNTLAEEVSTLVSARLAAGAYEAAWNASGFSSGVYFCRLSAGEFVQIRKLILVR
jgi:BNR/Asp-box repeat.